MSPTAQIQGLAQSVYRRIKNRAYDDITSADGQVFVANIIDFANGWLDELETELTPSGDPLYWNAVTQLNYPLGTAAVNTASIPVPTGINEVIIEEDRYIQVQQGGTTISNWLVVSPDAITNKTDRITEDMCTVVGGSIIFSRIFRSTEDQGAIVGDVTIPFPRFSLTNVKSLALIKPRELLVLGIAKNSVLPDIVKGSLTPSFVQKYQDLLTGAITRNEYSSRADTIDTEDYGHVRGIY
jgi:hypothetical protein